MTPTLILAALALTLLVVCLAWYMARRGNSAW